MQQVSLRLHDSDNFLLEEAYKFLRTNIRFCGQDLKTIVITSCNENEGKTTVSLYLAKSFAQLGKRTLIIDADMRKSVMASRNFGLNSVEGLSELLTAVQTDINQCLYKTDIQNLFVLFSGNTPPNPAELLSSKYFDAIIAAVRESFDYIIIDTPPLSPVTDAAIIAPKCDGSILVIGSPNLNRREAKSVIDQLKAGGAKVLGAIRNNVTKSAAIKHYGKKKIY